MCWKRLPVRRNIELKASRLLFGHSKESALVWLKDQIKNLQNPFTTNSPWRCSKKKETLFLNTCVQFLEDRGGAE